MSVVFRIHAGGLKGFTRAFGREFRNVIVTDQAVEDAAKRGVEIMKEMVGSQGSGRVYTTEWRTLKDKGGTYYVAPIAVNLDPGHRASRPFDPPALFRGNLQKGIDWQLKRVKKGEGAVAEVFVVGEEEKLASLEFGAPGHHSSHPEGLAPRPFVRPTIEKLQRELRGIYRKSITAEAKKRSKRFRHWMRGLFSGKRK